jgi:hypothetical protein
MATNPVLLGNTQPYVQGSTLSFDVKSLDPLKEVLAIKFEPVLSVKSSGTAFALAVPDYNTILNALWARFRMTYGGFADTIALTAPEMRSLAIDANGRDGHTAFIRVAADARYGQTADQVPANASPAAWKMPLLLDFCHRGLDTPNMFAPSSDQLNVPGTQINIDTGSGNLGALVLTNGTAIISVSQFRIYVLQAPTDYAYVAPVQEMKNFTIGQNAHVESEPMVELFLGDERDPATTETNWANVSVTRDGNVEPRSITPTALAQMYNDTNGTNDALQPVDLTRNTLGGTGSIFTPYTWISGHKRATEREWPVSYKYRRLEALLASGGTQTAQLLRRRVRPLAMSIGHVRSVFDQYRAQGGLDAVDPGQLLAQLAVRGFGGADNGLHEMFKARQMAQRASLARRAA